MALWCRWCWWDLVLGLWGAIMCWLQVTVDETGKVIFWARAREVLCSFWVLWYKSQVTYTYLKREEFRCQFLWIAVCNKLHIVCTMSAELSYPVRGMSEVCLWSSLGVWSTKSRMKNCRSCEMMIILARSRGRHPMTTTSPIVVAKKSCCAGGGAELWAGWERSISNIVFIPCICMWDMSV